MHVYEKHAKAGGLMRYGIPDFKMEKGVVDIRVAQMEAEGVTFHYGAHVGVDLPAEKLVEDYDAVALTGGAEQPRDLPIPGRELKGIHFAMDFLPQQNRRVSGEPLGDVPPILATGKHVVVIGGGDTGSDCIGTSIRQGALSVTNFEIMPQPPEHENKPLTWPLWPLKLRTSSSHEEGVERDFAVLTTKFSGANGQVKKLHCARADAKFQPMPGTEFEIKADLVLLAMGFVHPVHEGMIKSLGVELDRARQHQGRPDRLPNLAAEGVCGRRHAARPVAGGVGDPRGPPVRPRDRQVPDGSDDAAALSALPEEREEEAALRLRRPAVAARGGCWGRCTTRRGAAATVVGASAFGASTVFAGAPCITGSGSVVVATAGSAPNGATPRRGQAKSSPRPAGGSTASPFTSTRVTVTWSLCGTRTGAAEQAIFADIGGGGQRHHRAGERPRGCADRSSPQASAAVARRPATRPPPGHARPSALISRST